MVERTVSNGEAVGSIPSFSNLFLGFVRRLCVLCPFLLLLCSCMEPVAHGTEKVGVKIWSEKTDESKKIKAQTKSAFTAARWRWALLSQLLAPR